MDMLWSRQETTQKPQWAARGPSLQCRRKKGMAEQEGPRPWGLLCNEKVTVEILRPLEPLANLLIDRHYHNHHRSTTNPISLPRSRGPFIAISPHATSLMFEPPTHQGNPHRYTAYTFVHCEPQHSPVSRASETRLVASAKRSRPEI